MIECRPLFARSLEATGAAFVRTLQAQGYTLTQFKEIEKEKIVIQAMRQSEGR